MRVSYEATPDEIEYLIRLIMDLLREKNHMHLD